MEQRRFERVGGSGSGRRGNGSVPLLPRSHSDDSWIEVASQPSSSSLSSVTDEIITTGLRVQNDQNRQRRRVRRQQGQHVPSPLTNNSPRNGGTSSQEEYEETDSESDRVMTSSNEGLELSPLQRRTQITSSTSSDNLSSNDDNGDDSDENSTAINVPRGNAEAVFTPQPNAFTHPPTTTSYFPPVQTRPTARPSAQRHSCPSNIQPANPPRGIDHDEALRASLNTLLSCAAARSPPKDNQITSRGPLASNRMDPTSLRMITEEEILGLSPPASTRPGTSRQPTQPSVVPARSSSADKHKRKSGAAANARSSSKDRKKRRTSSPMRTAAVDEISPTLMTWVVSAGVLVLVSALSFSAGYVVGREAGRTEAEAAGAVVRPSGACATEVGKGLRRLRWSGAATSVRA